VHPNGLSRSSLIYFRYNCETITAEPFNQKERSTASVESADAQSRPLSTTLGFLKYHPQPIFKKPTIDGRSMERNGSEKYPQSHRIRCRFYQFSNLR
jgi:hypothetical protein